MNFVRLKPLPCWAGTGAARFFVVLVCLNVSRRGWLLKAVWFCALARGTNPIPMNSAVQIALRTMSPPSSLDYLARYSALLGKVGENSNCNAAVKPRLEWISEPEA